MQGSRCEFKGVTVGVAQACRCGGTAGAIAAGDHGTRLYGSGDSASFRSYDFLYYPPAFFNGKERFVKYSSWGMQSNFSTNVPFPLR